MGNAIYLASNKDQLTEQRRAFSTSRAVESKKKEAKKPDVDLYIHFQGPQHSSSEAGSGGKYRE
jgi:hypothetical protein